MRKSLLSATILLGLVSPSLAEQTPCHDLDAVKVSKVVQKIWIDNATPERPAIKIMDVVSVYALDAMEKYPICFLHVVTSQGDMAYGFRTDEINNRHYVTLTGVNMAWDRLLKTTVPRHLTN